MNPGKHEVDHRPPEPFVGPSGQLLNFGYTKAGVDRRQVSVANACQCRINLPYNLFPTDQKAAQYIPPDEARAAIAHCWRTYVVPIIQLRQWKRVDLLGVPPLEKATGKRGMDTWGGYALELQDAPYLGNVAVATYHPTLIMREAEKLPVFYSDLRRSLVPAPEQHVLQGDLDTDWPDPLRCLDLETTRAGGDMQAIQIRLLALSSTPYHGVCFAYNDNVAARLQSALRTLPHLYGQNIAAFDMPVLEAHGFTFNWNGPIESAQEMQVWDSMLIHHLLWPTLPHDLGYLGRMYTTQRAWKAWQNLEEPEELYACRDAANTLPIAQKLRAELEREPRLLHVYKYISLPLARMCVHMSQNGIVRDPQRITKLRERTEQEMLVEECNLDASLQTQMIQRNRRVAAPEGTLTKGGKPRKFVMEPYTEAMRPWASSKQVCDYLYVQKKYPAQHNDAGNFTAGKIAIEKLAHAKECQNDPSIKAIRKLRTFASRLNYCPLDEDGKPLTEVETLHPSFLPHGTSFGRLSSSGPNIQNWEEDVRVIVVPSRPGWEIGSVDFSQIEPRLTAWFSQDAERLARYDDPSFNEHKFVASLFFGLPMDQIPKDNDKDAMYGQAKRVNNGANYLLGYKTLSKMYDWDLTTTRKRCEDWKKLMPKCVVWQQRVAAEVKVSKMLYNPFRRRGLFYMPNCAPKAVAFGPQSTAADILHRAMLGLLYERIGWPRWKVEKVMRVIRPLPEPARVIAQVHDQLLFEYPKEIRAEVFGTVCEVMTQPWPELESALSPKGLAIPVSPEYSEESWGEMRAYRD